MNPFPVILSSPSGVGKTTIAKALLARRPDLGYSVSCTTRPARPGEVEGTDYYFLGKEDFQARLDRGEFAESAVVHGNHYGTLVAEIRRVFDSGRHVVMDVDIQGAALLRKAFPSVVTVFVLPPSGVVLLDRLMGRRTETRETIVRRLESALQELRAIEDYDYVVINDALEAAVDRVSAIIDAEESRRARFAGWQERVSELIRRVEDEIRTQSQ
jgi:guanylate kinase